jgi:transcriptional regulator NrdR family protein
MEGSAMKAPLVTRNYKCPVCDERLTIYVNPSEPPTHVCKKSANKVVEFEEVK